MQCWSPADVFERNSKRVSRETYLLLVACFGSIAGVVQGYTTTLSGILLMDQNFLDQMSDGDVTFTSRFIVLFYVGEIVGAILSFPLSDAFGRRNTLQYLSIACILALGWSSLTFSGADLLTSRFFSGWIVGVLMSTAPLYTSEVCCYALYFTS